MKNNKFIKLFYLTIFSCLNVVIIFGQETFPVELGNSLTAADYTYAVDDVGGAFNPHHVIIEWTSDATDEDKIITREDIQEEFPDILTIKPCMCDSLELWIFSDSLGIEQKIASARTKSKIEEAGYDYYAFNELDTTYILLPSLEILPPYATFSYNLPDAIIAHIDTGVDYFHDGLQDYLWHNPNFSDNCLENDTIGWNFVCDSDLPNNTPFDNHGHGTHVAGIIVNGLSSCDNIKIMPLKAFDRYGIGTTFQMTCAILYAIEENVQVINISAGFYGEFRDSILYNAIEKAKNNDIIIVTSAGNEVVNINDLNYYHYPSGYDLDNIITVGGIDENDADSSTDGCYFNYSTASSGNPHCIDINALGIDVYSTLPNNNCGLKSGTSMAVPHVTGVTAIEYVNLGLSTPYSIIKDNILLHTAIDISTSIICSSSSKKVKSSTILILPKIYLEGFYDTSTNMMSNNLLSLLPTQEPYSSLGYITRRRNNEILSSTVPPNMVDWILLELRADCDSIKIVATRCAILLNNGQIVDLDGISPVEFNATTGNYQLIIRHRNHLDIMTDSFHFFNDNPIPIPIDFTDTTNIITAGGSSAQTQLGGSLVMKAADCNNDGLVDTSDHTFWSSFVGLSVYHKADFNGDGLIGNNDLVNFYFHNLNAHSFALPQ